MGFRDTTLALPPELKEEIRSLKIIKGETFPSVLRRLIEDSKKVPGLEAENAALKKKVAELAKKGKEEE